MTSKTRTSWRGSRRRHTSRWSNSASNSSTWCRLSRRHSTWTCWGRPDPEPGRPFGAAPLRRVGVPRLPGDVLPDQDLADLVALDLVGALVDLRDLGVLHVFLGWVVPHVAIAAEDLHGI